MTSETRIFTIYQETDLRLKKILMAGNSVFFVEENRMDGHLIYFFKMIWIFKIDSKQGTHGPGR